MTERTTHGGAPKDGFSTYHSGLVMRRLFGSVERVVSVADNAMEQRQERRGGWAVPVRDGPYPACELVGLCPRFYFEHNNVQYDLFAGEGVIEVDDRRIIRQG